MDFREIAINILRRVQKSDDEANGTRELAKRIADDMEADDKTKEAPDAKR